MGEVIIRYPMASLSLPSILLLGAFSPEIHLLAEALHGRILENLPRHGDGEAISALLEIMEVGVGNQSAAFQLQKRLSRTGSPAVLEAIFIGSAGTYGSIPEGISSAHPSSLPGGIATGCSRLFWNRELAVLEGRAHLPDIFPGMVQTEAGPLGTILSEGLGSVEGATNSPDSITLVDPVIEGIALPEGMLFENMEAFGLSFVASRMELPFSALYALTNRVGPGGSREWALHHQEYSIALQRALLKAMEGRFIIET